MNIRTRFGKFKNVVALTKYESSYKIWKTSVFYYKNYVVIALADSLYEAGINHLKVCKNLKSDLAYYQY